MPRKAPDNVTEHRITFGNKEREMIQKSADKIALSNTIGAVGSAIGGISMGGLAIAALIYAGFNLDDWIDNWSTELTNWLNEAGWASGNHAEYYGLKILEAEAELATLLTELLSITNLGTKAGDERYAAIQKRMKVLGNRVKVLTSLIADIAAGRRAGYSFGIFQSNRDIMERDYDDEWQSVIDTTKYPEGDDIT